MRWKIQCNAKSIDLLMQFLSDCEPKKINPRLPISYNSGDVNWASLNLFNFWGDSPLSVKFPKSWKYMGPNMVSCSVRHDPETGRSLDNAGIFSRLRELDKAGLAIPTLWGLPAVPGQIYNDVRAIRDPSIGLFEYLQRRMPEIEKGFSLNPELSRFVGLSAVFEYPLKNGAFDHVGTYLAHASIDLGNNEVFINSLNLSRYPVTREGWAGLHSSNSPISVHEANVKYSPRAIEIQNADFSVSSDSGKNLVHVAYEYQTNFNIQSVGGSFLTTKDLPRLENGLTAMARVAIWLYQNRVDPKAVKQ